MFNAQMSITKLKNDLENCQEGFSYGKINDTQICIKEIQDGLGKIFMTLSTSKCLRDGSRMRYFLSEQYNGLLKEFMEFKLKFENKCED